MSAVCRKKQLLFIFDKKTPNVRLGPFWKCGPPICASAYGSLIMLTVLRDIRKPVSCLFPFSRTSVRHLP